MSGPLHVYSIEDGETLWYVAESAEHARQQYREDNVGPTNEEDWVVAQLLDEETFTVGGEDMPPVTMTCAEWAAAEGPRCIAGTCW